MKHAYLIIVHNEYSVLETLLSMIDDERMIFIYISTAAQQNCIKEPVFYVHRKPDYFYYLPAIKYTGETSAK